MNKKIIELCKQYDVDELWLSPQTTYDYNEPIYIVKTNMKTNSLDFFYFSGSLGIICGGKWLIDYDTDIANGGFAEYFEGSELIYKK